MEQVKIFQAAKYLADIEKVINKWLKEQEGKIEVIERNLLTTGHKDSPLLTVAIFYKKVK